MAELKWDQSGERFYELGVRKGVLYPMETGSTYGAGVAWNGLTGITESPGGAEPNDMYADDIKYASLRSAETFGATIEAYTYPDEFAECDGSKAVTAGVYIGQQPRKGFGLSYVTQIGNDTQTEDDDGYKLHLIYGATASPSEKAYATINDSPEGVTFSWELTTTPVSVSAAGYKPVSSIVIDSTKLDTTGKTKLKELEDKLYGRGAGNSQPTLPTPDEVIAMFTSTTSGS